MPNFGALLSTMGKLREQAMSKTMVEQNAPKGKTTQKDVDPLDAHPDVVHAKTAEEVAKAHTKLVKKTAELKQIGKELKYGPAQLPTLADSLSNDYGSLVADILNPKQGQEQSSGVLPSPVSGGSGSPVTPDKIEELKKILEGAVGNFKDLNVKAAGRPSPEVVKPERLSDLQRYGPLAGALIATLLGADPRAAGGLAGGIVNTTEGDAKASADYKNLLAQNAYKQQQGMDEAELQNAKLDVNVAETGLKEGIDFEEKRMIQEAMNYRNNRTVDGRLDLKRMDLAHKEYLASFKTPAAIYEAAKRLGYDDNDAREIAFSSDIKNLAASHASEAQAQSAEALAEQRNQMTPAMVAEMYSRVDKNKSGIRVDDARVREINEKIKHLPQKMAQEAAEIAQGWARIEVDRKNAETNRLKLNEKGSPASTAATQRKLMQNQSDAIDNQISLYKQAQTTLDKLKLAGDISDEEYEKAKSKNWEEIGKLNEELKMLAVPPPPK